MGPGLQMTGALDELQMKKNEPIGHKNRYPLICCQLENIKSLHTVQVFTFFFVCFLSSADYFFIFFFQNNFFEEKKSFRNTIRMSNSLDPDQAKTVCQGYQQTTLVDKEIKDKTPQIDVKTEPQQTQFARVYMNTMVIIQKKKRPNTQYGHVGTVASDFVGLLSNIHFSVDSTKKIVGNHPDMTSFLFGS